MQFISTSEELVNLGSDIFSQAHLYSWQDLKRTMHDCDNWLHNCTEQRAESDRDRGRHLNALAEHFNMLRNQATLIFNALPNADMQRKKAYEQRLKMVFADMVVLLREAEALCDWDYLPIQQSAVPHWLAA